MANDANAEMDEMEMIIIQLKDELRQYKMKTIGIKAKLIKRFQAVLIGGVEE